MELKCNHHLPCLKVPVEQLYEDVSTAGKKNRR